MTAPPPVQPSCSAACPLMVRKATSDDAQMLWRLSRDGIQITTAEYVSAQALAEWTAIRSEEGHRRLIATKVVLVATLRGEPAGFVVLDVDAGRVDLLLVEPESAGQGVTKELLAAADVAAREVGLTRLTALTTPRRVEVFTRNGYKGTGPVLVAGEGRGLRSYAVGKQLAPPRIPDQDTHGRSRSRHPGPGAPSRSGRGRLSGAAGAATKDTKPRPADMPAPGTPDLVLQRLCNNVRQS